MSEVHTNGVRSSATEFDAKIDADAFDRWLKAERFTAWQQGYAARVEDDNHGIGAEPDEWIDDSKSVERPQQNTWPGEGAKIWLRAMNRVWGDNG